MKLFQRALQHVDQKRLYLALLAILENSKKVKRAVRGMHSFASCSMPAILGSSENAIGGMTQDAMYPRPTLDVIAAYDCRESYGNACKLSWRSKCSRPCVASLWAAQK